VKFAFGYNPLSGRRLERLSMKFSEIILGFLLAVAPFAVGLVTPVLQHQENLLLDVFVKLIDPSAFFTAVLAFFAYGLWLLPNQVGGQTRA
jgi:hypothetical protein